MSGIWYGASGYFYYSQYIPNAYICGYVGGISVYKPHKTTAVVSPSDTVIYVENGKKDLASITAVTNQFSVIHGSRTKDAPAYPLPGGSNVLFSDLHVSWMSGTDFSNRIDSVNTGLTNTALTAGFRY